MPAQLKNKKVEIFHYSNEGVCSWFDFAKTIFEFEKLSLIVKPIETSKYPNIAKRPYYSVLNKRKIKQKYKIQIPYWSNSLRECLKRFNCT